MPTLNDIKRIHINRKTAWYAFSTRIRREGINWGWCHVAKPLQPSDYDQKYFTPQGLELINKLVLLPGLLSVRAGPYGIQLVIPDPFSADDYYEPVLDLIKSTLFADGDQIEIRTVDDGPASGEFAEGNRHRPPPPIPLGNY